jgi:hypothetical protein
MEHVPDPASFARKLLDTGNVVIASVPYLWPSKEAFGHLQHMIDADQLLKWCGACTLVHGCMPPTPSFPLWLRRSALLCCAHCAALPSVICRVFAGLGAPTTESLA